VTTPVGITVVVVAVVLAAALQASIGFGMGMLAAPVVALVDPRLVPGVIVLLGAAVTTIVVARERTAIDLRGTGWALAGRIPGTVVGSLLVAFLPERGLALVLAGVVLTGVVLNSLGWAPRPTRTAVVTAGTASGIFGTATGIGGPPMALVWQRRTGADLRGTMGGFFLVGSVISVIGLAAVGAVDGPMLLRTLWLLPAVAAGYLLSLVFNRHLDRRRLKLTAIGVSALGAVILIVQQLAGL
jgi:uncharacterized protein